MSEVSKSEKRRLNRFKKMVAMSHLLDKSGEHLIGSGASENGNGTSPKKMVLTEEQFNSVKHALNEKKQQLKNKPKFTLKESGELASLCLNIEQRTPLFLGDLHQMTLNLYFGKLYGSQSTWRWGHFKKMSKISHTIVVLVSGLSLYHYSSHESQFEDWKQLFPVQLDVVLLSNMRETVEKFLQLPLLDIDRKKMIAEYGSLDTAVQFQNKSMSLLSPIFPIDAAAEETESNACPPQDAFPRTKLLLSPLQMVDNQYPVPLLGELAHRYRDYILTKDKYEPVTAASPMYALDCEMCRTTLGINEITRVSIVNEKWESIYETFVKPENKIVDYMTEYSGITADMLRGVTKTLVEVQEDLKRLLPRDVILIGHSLNVDLNCLKIMHPYVIDTSLIYNISGERSRKSKLKTLSREFLDERIQENKKGHDSIEDSVACMKLVQLKLTKGVQYGDLVLINRERFQKSDTSANCKRVFVAASLGSNYDYESYGSRMARSSEQDSTRINFQLWPSSEEAMDKTALHAMDCDFSICHINAAAAETTPEHLPQFITGLKRGIQHIYNHMAVNGCLMVVLGGTEENPKGGAAFLRIKE